MFPVLGFIFQSSQESLRQSHKDENEARGSKVGTVKLVVHDVNAKFATIENYN